MPTQLSEFIASTKVIDTHEHMRKEHDWVEDGPPDVFHDLFKGYVNADLRVGGASGDAVATTAIGQCRRPSAAFVHMGRSQLGSPWT